MPYILYAYGITEDLKHIFVRPDVFLLRVRMTNRTRARYVPKRILHKAAHMSSNKQSLSRIRNKRPL